MDNQPRNKGKFASKGAEPLGKRISVRLHQSVEEKLSTIAAEKGCSSSELIRQLVTNSLMGEGKYLELIGEKESAS
ncbi:MAG: ribbon-helix-helix protein, CopG family [Symploca sp. SIO2C1]|nr:ribbon-helix-helix protein, CopG family [Symploca sp. SIO2C1]